MQNALAYRRTKSVVLMITSFGWLLILMRLKKVSQKSRDGAITVCQMATYPMKNLAENVTLTYDGLFSAPLLSR